jgi:hypothetical protein
MFFKILWLSLTTFDMRIIEMMVNYRLIPFFIFNILITFFTFQIANRIISPSLSE